MKGKRPINSGAPESERFRSKDAQPDATGADASPLGDTNVGNALRSVYQQTIDEAIPPEMMDLLKKLT